MGYFNRLPADIQLEIISRLPIESALDCKLICRSWRNLVSHHPSFSQLHLARVNQSADPGKLSFLVRDRNHQLYYFEFNETHVDCIRRFNLTPPFPDPYKFIGSFNGLVCLYDCHNHTACICNPLTREYVLLPSVNRDCDRHWIYRSSGFGYLPLTNEYKVVELYKLSAESDFIEVAVYTLGGGNGWKNVGRLDSKSFNIETSRCVFVNGALLWKTAIEGRVMAFDLAEEKFRKHITPPPLPQDYMYCTTGEVGGVLCYETRHYLSSSSNIWLLKEKNNNLDMKEQVEDEPLCWRKEFNLRESTPLAFTKSGGVLCYNWRSLDIYDPIASTLKKLVDFGTFLQIIPHKNTLISLKEFGEEDVNFLNSSEIEEKESRGDLTTMLLAK
ncbi:putative F-box protein At1g32420 [Papaver somniferum]|uniref:putative F-box protein At1g32420 n=1 Tax=Papaver somniferum TaxID=3469 RepID=UPI000E6F7FC9|nr:putative F-box protein At1g32420 [Papaver somniferum]